jgi:hypothetical protein
MYVLSAGHLDRVLHGINAEEVLYACDENPAASSSGDVGLANPAVHFFRGLRHRNLSAIRHATQVKSYSISTYRVFHYYSSCLVMFT